MAINNYSAPEDFAQTWGEFSVGKTGVYEEDIRLGEIYALVALQRAKSAEDQLSLATVLTDIIKAGEFGPMEAGFVARLTSAARAGAMD